jgi:hypothetical protein
MKYYKSNSSAKKKNKPDSITFFYSRNSMNRKPLQKSDLDSVESLGFPQVSKDGDIHLGTQEEF